MSTTRTDVLAAAQRQLNLDAAASMTQIAEAAGVSRATLHRHFASREALLVELGTRSLDRWEERLEAVVIPSRADSGADAGADPEVDSEGLARTLQTLVHGYVEDAGEFAFALTDPVILANEELRRRSDVLADREAELFVAAQGAGVLDATLPPRWLGHALYGQLVAVREAVRVGDVAPRDAARLVWSAWLDGVSA